MLHALSQPVQVIRRAQWDYCHMRGAPQALAEVLGSTGLVVLGTAIARSEAPLALRKLDTVAIGTVARETGLKIDAMRLLGALSSEQLRKAGVSEYSAGTAIARVVYTRAFEACSGVLRRAPHGQPHKPG